MAYILLIELAVV